MYLGKRWRKEEKTKCASRKAKKKHKEEQRMNMSNERSSILKAIWS